MTSQPWPPAAVSFGLGPIPAIYVPLRPLTGEKMPAIPADLRYSRDHLWVRRVNGTSVVRVGVTDFAQQSLGDIVDVSPPQPGETITTGDPCGDIESVKSVSDLIAPVTGTVRARNDDRPHAGTRQLRPVRPGLDLRGRGWIFEAEAGPAVLGQQFADLLDARSYRSLAGA
jgi:glycine cleavage system H protein